MKKYLAVIAVAFMFGLSAQAQVTVKPGLRTGASFARFSDTDFDFGTDFYLGGFIDFKLTKYYTLQPEITYSGQGAKAKYSNPENLSNAPKTINVDYLSFGIMNKITFTDEFNIFAGTILDYEVHSNITTNSDIDLALAAGFGYKLPVGLAIEGRAKFGMIDVLESDAYNNSGNYVGDWNTNVVLQIGVSYSFDAKGATK